MSTRFRTSCSSLAATPTTRAHAMCCGHRDRTANTIMRRHAIAAGLVGLLTANHVAANPFDDLTKNGDACFHRSYDAAHLAKNPRQLTTSMTVWVTTIDSMRSGNVGLGVTRRGETAPLFLAAGCDWGDDQSWMKSYQKKGGAGCVTLAVPDVFRDVSSAEEGGGVVLDPAPGGKTMLVHMDDRQSMVRRANRGRKISVLFGADDRVFMLRRADSKQCESVKDAVTTLEPKER